MWDAWGQTHIIRHFSRCINHSYSGVISSTVYCSGYAFAVHSQSVLVDTCGIYHNIYAPWKWIQIVYIIDQEISTEVLSGLFIYEVATATLMLRVLCCTA